jgi:hypothetical protein
MEINMNGNRFLAGGLSALALFAAGAVGAVEQAPSSHGARQQMERNMNGRMSCGDMMHMMGGSMMNHGQMMPSLPPGNEKLNMQMHAEMMQAMGAIMQKYADRIPTPQGK